MAKEYSPELERRYDLVPEKMWRTYNPIDCCVFRGTQFEYGEFSNMSSGFPLHIDDIELLSSEALYQCMRYPEHPEFQKQIIAAKTPMRAKMVSKKYRAQSREDWIHVRVNIMRWVLKIKASQHKKAFALSLISTGNKPIVEESAKDYFWGAKKNGEVLQGANVLGRLLMELREEINHGHFNFMNVPAPDNIRNFLLCEKNIGIVSSFRSNV